MLVHTDCHLEEVFLLQACIVGLGLHFYRHDRVPVLALIDLIYAYLVHIGYLGDLLRCAFDDVLLLNINSLATHTGLRGVLIVKDVLFLAFFLFFFDLLMNFSEFFLHFITVLLFKRFLVHLFMLL